MASRLASGSGNSPMARTNARFKKQCDDEGYGKACFDYARSRWSASDRKIAMRYFLRSCQLKYQPGCDFASNHSANTIRKSRQYSPKVNTGPVGKCFTKNDLTKATMSPNRISVSSVHGQKISAIMPNSFWSRVGLIENDVIVRVNNLPFNTPQESFTAFAQAGKKYGFEVLRNNETVTLWYSCP